MCLHLKAKVWCFPPVDQLFDLLIFFWNLEGKQCKIVFNVVSQTLLFLNSFMKNNPISKFQKYFIAQFPIYWSGSEQKIKNCSHPYVDSWKQAGSTKFHYAVLVAFRKRETSLTRKSRRKLTLCQPEFTRSGSPITKPLTVVTPLSKQRAGRAESAWWLVREGKH